MVFKQKSQEAIFLNLKVAELVKAEHASRSTGRKKAHPYPMGGVALR